MNGRRDNRDRRGGGGPPPDHYRGGGGRGPHYPPPEFYGGGGGPPPLGPGYGGGGGGYGRDYRDNNHSRGGGGPPFQQQPPPFLSHPGGGGGGGRYGEGNHQPFHRGGGGGPGGPHPPSQHGGGGGGGMNNNNNSNNNNPPNNNRRRPAPVGGKIITFRSYEEERDWVEERRRKRLARTTKFDVMPTPEQLASQSFIFPPVMMNGNGGQNNNNDDQRLWSSDPNDEYNQQMNPSRNMMMGQQGGNMMGDNNHNNNSVPQQTRHARRLYVGNLPQFITEEQIHKVFRDAIQQALVVPNNGESRNKYLDEDPIVSVYINHERRFCFLEFKSVELCTACMALDGLQVVPGQPAVKVKRPNDYNSTLAPKTMSLPELDVSRLGIISPTVLDGPNKIFIGGLHYHMTDAQVLELLQVFGKVKAFHLVKSDPDAVTSKGYCFVEYSDHALTPTVVANLNGMDIGGGKAITARLAGERHGAVASSMANPGSGGMGGGGGGMMGNQMNGMHIPVPPIVQAQQQLQQQHQQQHIQSGAYDSSLPPDRNIVTGYDIESLVDAALGLCPMPMAPAHFDSFGAPLTRIVQVVPQPVAVPALTLQQQQAINALPLLNLPPSGVGMMPQQQQPPPMMTDLSQQMMMQQQQQGNGMMMPVQYNNGMQQQMNEPQQMVGMPYNAMQQQQPMMNVNMMNNMQQQPLTAVPALTPEQQAAINAITMLPGVFAQPSQVMPVVGATQQQQQQQQIPATRILVLLNMVTDEDLATEDDHAGLVDEIRDECAKYGTLLHVRVPRPQEIHTTSGGGIVEVTAIRKVYLEYASVDDAVRAEMELTGRQFGTNVVETNYYSEDDFRNGHLR